MLHLCTLYIATFPCSIFPSSEKKNPVIPFRSDTEGRLANGYMAHLPIRIGYMGHLSSISVRKVINKRVVQGGL